MEVADDTFLRIRPNAIAALEELGIDVSEEFPKPLTDEVVRAVDVVITMGYGDAYPIYPGNASALIATRGGAFAGVIDQTQFFNALIGSSISHVRFDEA